MPREELFRGRDAQLIVGDDAGGEDATLAVAPGDNEASQQFAGLAQAFVSDGAFPPPPPNVGAPAPPPPLPGPELGPPAQQPWGDPNQPWGDPNQQAWPQASQAPMPPGIPGPPISSPSLPASNPQMPISGPNPQMPPGSNPHMMAAPAHMMPQSGQMPISQPGHPMQGPMGGPGPYPQSPISARHAPTWVAPRPSKFKISGQVLLLIVVGVVCLAIFVTGIVLFVSTKL